MTQEDFDYCIDFVRDNVAKLDISRDNTNVAVGLIANENGVASIKLDEYSDKSRLLDAIDQLSFPRTQASFSASLEMAQNQLLSGMNGGRENVPKIIVFITTSKRDFTDPVLIQVATDIKNLDTEIIGVVFGRDKDTVKTQLMQVVSRPAEDYGFTVTDSGSLSVIENKFREQLCLDVPGKS